MHCGIFVWNIVEFVRLVFCHSRVGMVGINGLAPVWRQGICKPHMPIVAYQEQTNVMWSLICRGIPTLPEDFSNISICTYTCICIYVYIYIYMPSPTRFLSWNIGQILLYGIGWYFFFLKFHGSMCGLLYVLHNRVLTVRIIIGIYCIWFGICGLPRTHTFY